MTKTSLTRRECLQKATEYAWLAENSGSEAAAAYAFDQSRYWRSLALVAPIDSVTAVDKSPDPDGG